MAALNIDETTRLRLVVSTLEAVLKEGYDPKDESIVGLNRRRMITTAKDDARLVVTMKGHYGK